MYGYIVLRQGEEEEAVIGPLASANHEIREAERRDHERRLARLSEPRRLTDQLLTQLEELNLDGVLTVPGSYEPRLTQLRDNLAESPRLSSRLVQRLQSGRPTAEVIETVFTIQEIIAPPTLVAGELPLEEAGVV